MNYKDNDQNFARVHVLKEEYYNIYIHLKHKNAKHTVCKLFFSCKFMTP